MKNKINDIDITRLYESTASRLNALGGKQVHSYKRKKRKGKNKNAHKILYKWLVHEIWKPSQTANKLPDLLGYIEPTNENTLNNIFISIISGQEKIMFKKYS